MLGKNLFKVESDVELTPKRFKALVLFYGPLIGNDALALYEFLIVKGSGIGFDEFSKLLNSLNISIDRFEEFLGRLNEVRLVKTLKDKNEERYILVLNNPLTEEEFIRNDILVRQFILKTSGNYYQSLLSNYRNNEKHDDFEDVSLKLSPEELALWNKDNEKYLKVQSCDENYDFGTLFDLNGFLRDVSHNLLPLKFRTETNLKELAELADLYNISPDKMRTFLPKIAKSDSDNLDLGMLRYLCENSVSDYSTISSGDYKVPCVLFLMNRQDGKEVSKYDRRILYNLSKNYHLKPEVINVLIEYCLNNLGNRLIEKYLYGVASDLNRNGIEDADKALAFLNNSSRNSSNRINRSEAIPKYENENNPAFDEDTFKEIMNKRAK